MENSQLVKILFGSLLLLPLGAGLASLKNGDVIVPPSSEEKISTENSTPPLTSFGTVTLTPDFFLDGAGSTIDSPEIFEADQPENTLLLVTGKENNTVEVWQYPFQGKEFTPIQRESLPNGIGIDQDTNQLLIGDAEKEIVEVRSLPDLHILSTIGKEQLGSGETNVDVLTLSDGKKHLYATESHKVQVFDLSNGHYLHSFSPDVESIEEVLADSYHKIIYVPEEKGVASKKHPGGAITAYSPDGQPFVKNTTNIFGKGLYSGDGEGITLYACLGENDQDTGKGFIISSDQIENSNHFEFFHRENWQHLGTLILEGVSLTDGIDASSKPLPHYPKGLLAVANNDKDTAVISWEKVEEATGLSCQ